MYDYTQHTRVKGPFEGGLCLHDRKAHTTSGDWATLLHVVCEQQSLQHERERKQRQAAATAAAAAAQPTYLPQLQQLAEVELQRGFERGSGRRNASDQEGGAMPGAAQRFKQAELGAEGWGGGGWAAARMPHALEGAAWAWHDVMAHRRTHPAAVMSKAVAAGHLHILSDPARSMYKPWKDIVQTLEACCSVNPSHLLHRERQLHCIQGVTCGGGRAGWHVGWVGGLARGAGGWVGGWVGPSSTPPIPSRRCLDGPHHSTLRMRWRTMQAGGTPKNVLHGEGAGCGGGWALGEGGGCCGGCTHASPLSSWSNSVTGAMMVPSFTRPPRVFWRSISFCCKGVRGGVRWGEVG